MNHEKKSPPSGRRMEGRIYRTIEARRLQGGNYQQAGDIQAGSEQARVSVADHMAARMQWFNPSQQRSEDEVDRVLSILDELEGRGE